MIPYGSYMKHIEPPIDAIRPDWRKEFKRLEGAYAPATIRAYYTDLADGNLFENVGPLVDSHIEDKPLSIALHEISEGKIVMEDKA